MKKNGKVFGDLAAFCCSLMFLVTSACADGVAEVINASGDLVGTYDSANAAFGAIASGSDGSTLRLLADCTVTGCGDFGKSFTLDLNGFALTADYSSKGSDNYFLSPETSGKTLTIKNGKFVCGSRCMGIANLKDGTLIMEGVTSTSSAASPDINQEAGSSTIRNCVFDGDSRRVMGVYVGGGVGIVENCDVTVRSGSTWQSAALAVAGNATLTVKGGTYTSPAYSMYILSSGGTINVEGGNFSGPIYLDGNSDASYGRMNIKGGDFTSVTKFGGRNGTYNSYMVTGGTFAADPSKDVLTIQTGYEVKDNGDGTYTVQKEDNSVADVDGTGYETIRAAIVAANESGKDVTVLKDCTLDYAKYTDVIALSKSFAIDLNGKTLRLANGTSTGLLLINDPNEVTLTVKNGTITGVSTTSQICGLAENNSTKGVVRIEDVQATTYNNTFVKLYAAGARAEIVNSSVLYAGGYQTPCFMAYSGGVIAFQDASVDVTASTGTKNTTSAAAVLFSSSKVTLGGACTLKVKSGISLIHQASGTSVEVNAGTYNFDPRSYTLASGCTVSGPVNGIYTVSAAAPTPPAEDAVAKIGNAEYASLNAALAAVKDGETIDVCDDCALDAATVSVTKSFAIDLHEKTLTLPSFAGTLFEVTAAVALTISNGSVKAEGSSKTVFIDLNSTGGTVRLTDLTATVACADAYWIDALVDNATLAIENCEFCSVAGRKVALVRVKGSDQVSIVDSTLDNRQSSGTGANTAAAIGTVGGDGGVIALSGDCRLYAPAGKAVIGTNFGSVSTGAGTYNFNPEALENWKPSEGHEVTGPDSDGIYTVVKKAADAAVKVDDTPYASLAEALSHLTAGCTMTLLKDQTTADTITLSVSCTIDLGGCKLSFSGSGAFIEAGSNNPTLTIKNGSLDMTDATTTTLNSCVSIPQYSPATIVIDGVTAKVRGGKLRSAFAVSDEGGSMTIGNCTITELSTGETSATVGINGNGGTINIVNTTVDASAVASSSSNFKRSAVMVNAAGAIMNISGTSSFVGKKYSAAACNGTINISGGLFPQGLDKGSGTFVVTGGAFGSDPTAYVDTTAYDVTENPAGTWTVTVKALPVILTMPSSLPEGVASFKINNLTQNTSTPCVAGGSLTINKGDEIELEIVPAEGYESAESGGALKKNLGAITEDKTIKKSNFPSVRKIVVEAIRISVEGEDDVTVGSFGEVTAYLNDQFEVEAATLTLLQDIGGGASVAFEDPFSVTCNLTLDLNGRTLCWDGFNAAFDVTPYVQFVVTDGAGGGVLTTSFDDVIGSYGQLTIAGGTIQGAVYAYAGEGSSIAITGGTFDVLPVATDFEGFISGGRFKDKPAAECFASGKAASAEVDAEGYYTVIDKPTSYKIEIRDENGDLIGGSDSWGLKDACDAVKVAGMDGRTIKVTQDLGDIANISGYDFGCSVTIDLGGHAFRNTSSTGAYMYTPSTAGKTLAIVNGHVTFSNDACYGLAQVFDGTFFASNITCTAGAQASGKASVLVNGSGAAKIIDCTFDGEKRWGSALYVASNNATGEIGGTTTVRCPNALPDSASGNWYAHATVRVSDGGRVTINGGTYVGAKFALYILTSGGTINVDGGAFTGNVALDGDGNTRRGYCNISDGNFANADLSILHNRSAYNTYTVTGGTFKDDPSQYIPPTSGKEATKQGDVWVVGDKKAHAKKGPVLMFW